MLEEEEACSRIAARQHGLVTAAQAKAVGFSKHMISRRVVAGVWARVLPSVFRLGGAVRTHAQRLQAAALWAGDDGALSHGAAAAVWGFDVFRDALPELTVTTDRRLDGALRVHRVDSLPKRDIVTRRGLRITSMPRTLLDVAGSGDDRVTRACINEALRRRWLTVETLRQLVADSRGAPGVEVLRELLQELEGGDGPTESQLEDAVVEALIWAGLPRPRRQLAAVVDGRVRRLDFQFEGTPVVLEADGFAWHSTLRAFDEDRARHNALTSRGFILIRWTWAALQQHPERLTGQLREVLARFIRLA